MLAVVMFLRHKGMELKLTKSMLLGTTVFELCAVPCTDTVVLHAFEHGAMHFTYLTKIVA